MRLRSSRVAKWLASQLITDERLLMRNGRRCDEERAGQAVHRFDAKHGRLEFYQALATRYRIMLRVYELQESRYGSQPHSKSVYQPPGRQPYEPLVDYIFVWKDGVCYYRLEDQRWRTPRIATNLRACNAPSHWPSSGWHGAGAHATRLVDRY